MRIERLFNVLVLGGAALGGACGNEPAEDDDGGSRAGAGGSGIGGGSTSGVGGASDGMGGASGTDPGGGEPAAGASAAGAAAGNGGFSGELECRLDRLGRGDPADPCGCPCCWLMDCANDEECCANFCALGDDGRGCCGQ